MTKVILSLTAISSLILMSLLIKLGYFGITPFCFWIIALFTTFCIFLLKKNIPKINLKHYHLYIIILITFLYSLRGILFINPSNLYFHGDEGIISRNAQNNFINAVSMGKWNLLGSEGGTLNKLPALWYFIQGFVITVLGPSIFSIKFFSLITDFFICILGYLLVKKVLDSRFGLIFILIYATLPISIHFSLTGYQNIQSTFFLIISLYFLIISINNKRNNSFYTLLSGITSALSFYFYLSALVVPIILVISIMVICFISNIPFKSIIKILATYSIGLIEGLIPYFAYSYFHYPFIVGRKEAILSLNSTNNVLSLLFNQTKTYLLGFLPGGSMSGSGFFYGYLPGFNTWILLIIFILGIIYILYKKDILGIISIIVIIITSIFGGILTSEPPAPQRLIHLFPFMVITICFGIKFIIIFLNKTVPFLNQKILLFSIVFIIFSTNIYSFIHSNLSTYRTFFNQDVYEISQIIGANKKPVFFDTYSTRINQLFYLTNGSINPQVVKNCITRQKYLQQYKSIYFIVDGFNTLLDCRFNESKTLIKEWPTLYGQTSLYEFNYIDV